MHDRRHTERIQEPWEAVPRGSHLLLFLGMSAFLAALLAAGAGAQNGTTPGGELRMDKADLPTAINQPPDANVQLRSHLLRQHREKLDALNQERLRQIADETAKLLLLARDLQHRMDKIESGPLPALVVREADVIEKLAHDVQARMTATVAVE